MKPDGWPCDEADWVGIIAIAIGLLVLSPCGLAWLAWAAWRLMAIGVAE